MVYAFDGGGVEFRGGAGGAARLEGCALLRNIAYGGGGGALLDGAAAAVAGSVFEGNAATVGAGLNAQARARAAHSNNLRSGFQRPKCLPARCPALYNATSV